MLNKFTSFCKTCLDGDKYIIYVLLILLLSILTYFVSFYIFLTIILLLSTVLLLIGHDNKAVLPLFFNAVFLNGNIMTAAKPNYFLIIPALASVCFIFVYFLITNIRHKQKIELGKSFIPILLMAVMNIINLFWNNTISDRNTVLYLLYFTWLLYFLIYFFAKNNFKQVNIKQLSYTLLGTGLLIATQINVVLLKSSIVNHIMFNSSHNFGWGITNEAGIVLLLCFPFVFMLFINSINLKQKLTVVRAMQLFLYGVTLFIMIVAAFIGGSRGTILFLFLELVVYFGIVLYRLEFKIHTIILTYLVVFMFVFGYLLGNKDFTNGLINKFISGNGRISLYNSALDNLTRTKYNFFLGNGIVAKIDVDNRMVVYHSIIFETLSQVGILGSLLVVVIIANKYLPFYKRRNIYSTIMILGYFFLDLYGLIDNTYHMYYYMIPLLIIMTIVENIESENPYNLNLDFFDESKFSGKAIDSIDFVKVGDINE